MGSGILFAALAAVMWTGVAYAFTVATKRNVAVAPFYAIASGLGALSAALAVNWNGATHEEATRHIGLLALSMAGSGIINALAMLCFLRAFACGHNGATWAFSQMAMVVSFIYAAIAWQEPAGWIQYAGLILIAAMVRMLAPSRTAPQENSPNRLNLKWAAYVLAGLALAGIAQVLFLIPSRHGASDPAEIRPLLFLASAAFFSGVLAALMRRPVTRAMWPPAILLAACSVLGLQFIAASGDRLAPFNMAGIVYPVATAGTVILFSLCSRFVLREQFGRAKWLGIALGVAGIILLNIR